MLDIKYIRENAEEVKRFSRDKGCEVDVDKLLEVDVRRRELETELDELRSRRNLLAEAGKNTKPSEEQITTGRELKEKIAVLEKEYGEIAVIFTTLFKALPNKPWKDVPVGVKEEDNVVEEAVGGTTNFSFRPKNHWELASEKGWIDKERAAKVAGARFAFVKGDLVKLQMAVVSWVMKILTNEATIKKIIEKFGVKNVSSRPFTPILPPLMLKTEVYDAMDRLEPRDDRYKIEGEELWLQGSAEHVIGPMYMNEILGEGELPLRYLGYATSFRKEAGTYGKDTEGIIRMHQFDKLELESFTTAENGFNEHLFLIAVQRFLLEELRLPYRVLMKSTFDIGKPNARGVDLEVWLPGQSKYRETHTADYMTDYQARRMKTRVRREGGEIELIHTNDATALALGRTLIAIIENYQTSSGDVRVPEVLKEFVGKDKI